MEFAVITSSWPTRSGIEESLAGPNSRLKHSMLKTRPQTRTSEFANASTTTSRQRAISQTIISVLCCRRSTTAPAASPKRNAGRNRKNISQKRPKLPPSLPTESISTPTMTQSPVLEMPWPIQRAMKLRFFRTFLKADTSRFTWVAGSSPLGAPVLSPVSGGSSKLSVLV